MDVLPILREGNRWRQDRFCPQCGRKQIDIVAEAPDNVTSYMVQPMQAELEDVAIDLKYNGRLEFLLSSCRFVGWQIY